MQAPLLAPEHVPRPPSRSEFLLRDTLRRAEEHERRLASPSLSSRRRLKDVSLGPLVDSDEWTDGECDCDEDTRISHFDLLFPRSSRSPSTVRSPAASPPSKQPVLSRSHTSHTVPDTPSKRHHFQSRYSLPNAVLPSSSGQNSVESSPQSRHLSLSPHEAVLRAKLESVLKVGSDERKEQTMTSNPRPISHSRSKSHSVSHTQGQRPDWFTVSRLGSSDSLSSFNMGPDLFRSKFSMEQQRRRCTNNMTSPSSPTEPLTPPPTPPFNAREASEMCKRIDGYVSFASVEGLGEPPGAEYCDDSDDTARTGSRWWRLWPFTHAAHQDPSIEPRSDPEPRIASR